MLLDSTNMGLIFYRIQVNLGQGYYQTQVHLGHTCCQAQTYWIWHDCCCYIIIIIVVGGGGGVVIITSSLSLSQQFHFIPLIEMFPNNSIPLIEE